MTTAATYQFRPPNADEGEEHRVHVIASGFDWGIKSVTLDPTSSKADKFDLEKSTKLVLGFEPTDDMADGLSKFMSKLGIQQTDSVVSLGGKETRYSYVITNKDIIPTMVALSQAEKHFIPPDIADQIIGEELKVLGKKTSAMGLCETKIHKDDDQELERMILRRRERPGGGKPIPYLESCKINYPHSQITDIFEVGSSAPAAGEERKYCTLCNTQMHFKDVYEAEEFARFLENKGFDNQMFAKYKQVDDGLEGAKKPMLDSDNNPITDGADIVVKRCRVEQVIPMLKRQNILPSFITDEISKWSDTRYGKLQPTDFYEGATILYHEEPLVLPPQKSLSEEGWREFIEATNTPLTFSKT